MPVYWSVPPCAVQEFGFCLSACCLPQFSDYLWNWIIFNFVIGYSYCLFDILKMAKKKPTKKSMGCLLYLGQQRWGREGVMADGDGGWEEEQCGLRREDLQFGYMGSLRLAWAIWQSPCLPSKKMSHLEIAYHTRGWWRQDRERST